MSDLIVNEDNTEEFGNRMAPAIIRALEKIGLTAEGYAVKLAPVDTGRLRGSVTHALDNDEPAVYIGTNVEYAPFQEIGTSRHAAANGGRGFLRPAAQDHMDQYRDILRGELESG